MKINYLSSAEVLALKIKCLEEQLALKINAENMGALASATIVFPLLLTLDKDKDYQVSLTVFRNGAIKEDIVYYGGCEGTAWNIFDNLGDLLDVAQSMIIEDGVYCM